MPICFELHKNGEAVTLVRVDEEICRHFGEEPHPTMYYRGWFDSIGFALASGKSFEEIRLMFPTMVDITNFIEKTYEPKSWWEPKC